MKKIGILLLTLVCLLALAGCGCEHEWVEADCVTPKTCSLCGETEGEALGHTWVDATCTEPKTCSVCGETEGEALGHTWIDATTEAPKTCTVCAATEGERIITDARFTTAACAPIFGKWDATISMSGSDLDEGLGDYLETFDCVISMEFRNDGTGVMTTLPADEDEYMDAMQRYTVNSMYAEFAAMDLDKDAADAAFAATYNMTIEEYVAAVLAEIDVATIFSAMDYSFVYYVDGDQIYLGDSWDSDLAANEYTLSGDTLVLMGGEQIVDFTRVKE